MGSPPHARSSQASPRHGSCSSPEQKQPPSSPRLQPTASSSRNTSLICANNSSQQPVEGDASPVNRQLRAPDEVHDQHNQQDDHEDPDQTVASTSDGEHPYLLRSKVTSCEQRRGANSDTQISGTARLARAPYRSCGGGVDDDPRHAAG